MKKLSVYLIIGLTLLLILSCKRDVLEIKKEMPVFSINQAKEWFEKNLQTAVKVRATNNASRLIDSLPPNNKTLLWKFAIQKKNSEVEAVELPYSGTAVVCEIPDSSYKNNQQRNALALAIAKRVVIYKKPNGVIELMLVHIVPSYNYLLTHPNHFKENYFLKLPLDFTGWIYTYDWNDNPKSVSEVKNGKLIWGKTRVIQQNSVTNNRWVYACHPVCSYVWIGSVMANCGNPSDPHYEYCIYNSQYSQGGWTYSCRSECGWLWIPDQWTGSGGTGQSGNGPPPEDCNYYGTCEQSDDEVVDNINISLSNPCFQSAVIKINNANSLSTDIGFILHECFTFWQPKDLFISQACLSDTSTDATTSNATYEVILKFNECALHNASQEYIAATLYHEILHAYFFADGRNIDDHQEMATKYINAMKNTLLEHFPNLTNLDAEALAWGGLSKSQAWQTFQQNDLGRTLDIQNTNRKHKRGQAGTPCPPPPPPPPPPTEGPNH
jgi:hypothetical protein